MEQNQQSSAEQYSEQIEQLMELGRTQGYLTLCGNLMTCFRKM